MDEADGGTIHAEIHPHRDRRGSKQVDLRKIQTKILSLNQRRQLLPVVASLDGTL